MATLSFNQRNKTIKVLGDVKINGLLNSLGIETADQWDGWTLMPTNSVINEPDKVVHFVEMPELNNDPLFMPLSPGFDAGFGLDATPPQPSPDTSPDEQPMPSPDEPPILNPQTASRAISTIPAEQMQFITFRTPEDGC